MQCVPFDALLQTEKHSLGNKQYILVLNSSVSPVAGFLQFLFYFIVTNQKFLNSKLSTTINHTLIQDYYLVQLIEHPILRIPNILSVFFLSIFSDRSFKLISKYTQKCQYNLLY